MIWNSYSYALLGCCLLLAVFVIILLIKQKKRNAVSENLTNEEDVHPTLEEQMLLSKIEQGLKNGEFKMHLQFIVDNKTKHIVSAEALSRWERADGEVAYPGAYIGIMEKFGLIKELDYHMFECACEKLEHWNVGNFANFTISCNFTRITISEKDFVAKIKEIANRYEFDRRKLIIEITEDSIEKNLEVAMNNILQVKELGFRVALDDIGCGYTSLINLCEYPIDIVKIDRAILLRTNQERGKKLFSGIISLAHYLNLKVVCEGVETEEQNELVGSGECDYVQGWYYSKALDPVRAETFATDYMKKF